MGSTWVAVVRGMGETFAKGWRRTDKRRRTPKKEKMVIERADELRFRVDILF